MSKPDLDTTASTMRRLGLTTAATTWLEAYGWRGQHTREHTRHFQDFTIDGRPLRTWVGTDGEPDQGLTPLSEGGPQEAAQAVSLLDFLLGERPGFYDDGCEPILICPIDEDLLCGSLAVQVLRHRNTATWRLGWHTIDDRGDVQRHTAPQPPAPEVFTFERSEHDEVLRRARARFRTAAGDTPALPWFPG